MMTEEKTRPLTPIPDDPVNQQYWLEAFMHRIMKQMREERRLEKEEVKRQHSEHRERLDMLESSMEEHTKQIGTVSEKQDQLIEMLEPVVTTGRFVRLLDRGARKLLSSWLVRTLVLGSAAFSAWLHGGWKVVWTTVLSFFK